MDNQRPLLRRLNGRSQACDQCRARKVACDHDQPTCGRCRKRHQNCVYTISPKSTRSQPLPLPRGAGTTGPILTPPCSGYLGFTSHNAVFEETRNSLTLVRGPLDVGPSPNQPPARFNLTELPPRIRDMSLFALRNFPRLDDPLNYDPCRTDSWVREAVSRIVQTLRNISGHLDDETSLEEVASVISANTAQPFRETNISVQDWLGQFQGNALRWESIGLIWTFWNSSNINNVDLALQYCIELALYFTPSNEIILYLSYQRVLVTSTIAGDASLSCWRSHGETVAMMTFLGLHAERSSADYEPDLVKENRRRIFALVFNIDKVVVSFTGRPPLIHRRYSSTPLPLDLADEDLCVGGERLQRAVAGLDGNGWSKDGRLAPVTLLRARVMISRIREELLEIALGSGCASTLEQLQDIKQRHINTVAQFPASLDFHAEDLDNPNPNIDQLCNALLVRLEHLQNIFFVERLMLRFGGQDNGQLLITSFELVSLTVSHWTHRDLFASIRRDFEWLLMGYAAPGGGILCLELLRPTLYGAHPDNPKITRSSIIQQLSLLVGFLSWVQPSAPNADLCYECKTVIQAVLDHSLNNVADGSTLDWESWQLNFDFNLLDTFDWMHPATTET